MPHLLTQNVPEHRIAAPISREVEYLEMHRILDVPNMKAEIN